MEAKADLTILTSLFSSHSPTAIFHSCHLYLFRAIKNIRDTIRVLSFLSLTLGFHFLLHCGFEFDSLLFPLNELGDASKKNLRIVFSSIFCSYFFFTCFLIDFYFAYSRCVIKKLNFSIYVFARFFFYFWIWTVLENKLKFCLVCFRILDSVMIFSWS